MDREAAAGQAVAVMGDPKELAPMLAEIHRPFWGYVYSISKWLLIIATVLMLINLGIYVHRSNFSTPTTSFAYEPYTDTVKVDEFGNRWERVLYVEPDVSTSSDGYTFPVTRAAQWQAANAEVSGYLNSTQLHLQLKVINPRPWAEHTDIGRWFWADDSLGNHYYSYYDRNYNNDPAINGSYERTGIFTSTYDMYFDNYASMDAEWIDLHYDRAGRDVVLRINLTGGES